MGFGDLRVIEEEIKKASTGLSGNTKGGISGIPGQYPTTPTQTTTPAKTTIPTQTTTSATPKMTDEEAMADALRRYDEYLKNTGGTPQTPKDGDKTNSVINPELQTVVINQQQDDTVRWIQEMKEAAMAEGPCENPDLQDDSENNNEVIE